MIRLPVGRSHRTEPANGPQCGSHTPRTESDRSLTNKEYEDTKKRLIKKYTSQDRRPRQAAL